jgi:hypothetical protein
VTTGIVNVAYVLPEQALAGSLRLVFNDGMTIRTLTLATASENSGVARFHLLDPVNPLLSPEISSGPAIPDPIYTVHSRLSDAHRPRRCIVDTGSEL